MKDRDNRQDLATAWDSCIINFNIPYEKLSNSMAQLERLCLQLTWPTNWSFRSVGLLNYHNTNESAYCFRFSVSGPPRAADGAYVRAKLNMIPENFSEHTEAANG